MQEEFEKRMKVKFIKGYLFYSLWKDLTIEKRYFITNDYNFIDTFYAENDEKAKEYFDNKNAKREVQ